jgi:hypothetical protein
MLRKFPCAFSMAMAFIVGFAAVYALLDDGPVGPSVTLRLDWSKVAGSSTHAKAPRAVSRPIVQASLPVLPEAFAWRHSLPEFSRSGPVTRSFTKLVSFDASPFPYKGVVPRTHKPFLNYQDDGRQGRKTHSGRIYWADKTYSDNRVLLHIPRGFDDRKPSVMVVFFHGHGAILKRDVIARQRVPEQITRSGINAVLVAPQFAVDARDSSAGKLWKPGGMRRFLNEAADKLTELHGDPDARRSFAKMPVVIVGYSGGYLPTASALARGGVEDRVKGVVLLDGLYGEVRTFANWIARDNAGFFLSVYTGSTLRGNNALKDILSKRGIGYTTALAPALAPGSVTFISADEEHRDYVTRAWTSYPIADLLNRLAGTAPTAPVAVSAALAPTIAN